MDPAAWIPSLHIDLDREFPDSRQAIQSALLALASPGDPERPYLADTLARRCPPLLVEPPTHRVVLNALDLAHECGHVAAGFANVSALAGTVGAFEALRDALIAYATVLRQFLLRNGIEQDTYPPHSNLCLDMLDEGEPW